MGEDGQVKELDDPADDEAHVPEIVVAGVANEEATHTATESAACPNTPDDARPPTLRLSGTQRTRDKEKDPRFKYKKSSDIQRAQAALDKEATKQELAVPLDKMEGKERSGEGLRKRINARNTALLLAMSEILDASTAPQSDRRDSMTIMSRQLRTQFSAQQIVRSCEDLLTLVRWMQERWLCGNLNTIGQSTVESETEKDAQEIVEMLKRLDGMETIKQESDS